KDVVIPAIEEGARRAGRKRSDIQLYSPIFATTGSTQAEWDRAVEEVRRQISFYGSTPPYRPVLEHHGLGDVATQLSDLARRGEWAAMPKLIPDSLLDTVGVVAKPSELPAAIHRRYDGILDRVSLYFPIRKEEPEAAWKEFAAAFRAVPKA
ncbi:MAG: LLM class flavin-dependent oxidoreductase, partial [Candidatus Binatia bacterium]